MGSTTVNYDQKPIQPTPRAESRPRKERAERITTPTTPQLKHL
jgi:hypothetical protein